MALYPCVTTNPVQDTKPTGMHICSYSLKGVSYAPIDTEQYLHQGLYFYPRRVMVSLWKRGSLSSCHHLCFLHTALIVSPYNSASCSYEYLIFQFSQLHRDNPRTINVHPYSLLKIMDIVITLLKNWMYKQRLCKNTWQHRIL